MMMAPSESSLLNPGLQGWQQEQRTGGFQRNADSSSTQTQNLHFDRIPG